MGGRHRGSFDHDLLLDLILTLLARWTRAQMELFYRRHMTFTMYWPPNLGGSDWPQKLQFRYLVLIVSS